MSAAPCEILTLGETMVALRGGGPLKLGGSLEVSVAGAESNVAIGLARLGHTVRWAGAVGAGDAFVAGYLSALLDGADVTARLDRAVTTGAFAVASRGDWEGAPTRSELRLLEAPHGTVVR
ncbi:PfkB family carbohydrate kinase [Streptomyces kanamyceticus]|uniref:PfkB family carbohydrate kinase n=1 Tax=Streptomyces kanamyceticus TaxID=1967 RepID=UPI0037DD3940